MRAAVLEIDGDLPIYDIKTMNQWLSESMGLRRTVLLVLGSFALIALVLALGGTYSVMSYSVSHRTREIGIRMALGAQPRDILLAVARSGLTLAAAGVFIGTAASIALTRVMSSLLFDLEPADPPTLAVTALAVFVVATLACILPTYKAAKVNPVIALRHE